MQSYQQDFIKFALQHQVLRFGEFTLKSGRQSPYFFNAGLFNSGLALAKLGEFYAQAIKDSAVKYDMLFGPAYKGIPLATTTSIALAKHQQRDVAICFNRKEAKSHGEGGSLVGAKMQGRVLVIDDVITAGTAIKEAVEIINQQHAILAGAVIALDRQERGQSKLSSIEEIEQHYNIPVISIIKLEHILTYVAQQNDMKPWLDKISNYREQYGV